MVAPPLPQRPQLNDKPRSSWLTIALAAFSALVLILVLTFLTNGIFGRLTILSSVLFGVIGMQYLLWGWAFERIYRSQVADERQQEIRNLKHEIRNEFK